MMWQFALLTGLCMLQLLVPCLSITCRLLDRDMVVCGYRVPKGTSLSMAVWPVHHSARNFTQPERFWPERYEHTQTNGSYTPGALQHKPQGHRGFDSVTV